MTKITIKKLNNHIISVYASGHADYSNSENGDVLCASISSIIQSAVLGVKKLVKIKTEYQINENTGELSFKVKQQLNDKKQLQIDSILETMLLALTDLSKGYKQNINLEVKEDVY